jgi:hypothetical protein
MRQKIHFAKNVIWVQKRAEFEADFKADLYYCVQLFFAYDFFGELFAIFNEF